jgi:hypothetical protein
MAVSTGECVRVAGALHIEGLERHPNLAVFPLTTVKIRNSGYDPEGVRFHSASQKSTD